MQRRYLSLLLELALNSYEYIRQVAAPTMTQVQVQYRQHIFFFSIAFQNK